MKNLRNEPESTSTGTSTFAIAVPAAYPDRKRRKCHGKTCNNATTCLCLNRANQLEELAPLADRK